MATTDETPRADARTPETLIDEFDGAMLAYRSDCTEESWQRAESARRALLDRLSAYPTPTAAGLRVAVDPDMPPGTVEFRSDGRVVGRITDIETEGGGDE